MNFFVLFIYNAHVIGSFNHSSRFFLVIYFWNIASRHYLSIKWKWSNNKWTNCKHLNCFITIFNFHTWWSVQEISNFSLWLFCDDSSKTFFQHYVFCYNKMSGEWILQDIFLFRFRKMQLPGVIIIKVWMIKNVL